jgi:hypothetical protein
MIACYRLQVPATERLAYHGLFAGGVPSKPRETPSCHQTKMAHSMSDAPSGVILILEGYPLDDTTFFTSYADAYCLAGDSD